MNLTRVEGTARHCLHADSVEIVSAGLLDRLLLVVIAQTASLLQTHDAFDEHFLIADLRSAARTADSLVTDKETVVAEGLLAVGTAGERVAQAPANRAETARFEQLVVDEEVLQEGVAAAAVDWVLRAAGSAQPANSALIRLKAVNTERNRLLPTVLTEESRFGLGGTAEGAAVAALLGL